MSWIDRLKQHGLFRIKPIKIQRIKSYALFSQAAFESGCVAHHKFKDHKLAALCCFYRSKILFRPDLVLTSFLKN